MKVNSIEFANSEEEYSNFLNKFKIFRDKYLKRKSVIQDFLECDFKMNSVSNDFMIGFLGVSKFYKRKNKLTFIFKISQRLYEPPQEYKIVCAYSDEHLILNLFEVKNSFYKLLVMNEYWIGYYDTMLNREETFRNILLNKGDKLKGIPDHSIHSIQRIYLDHTKMIVKHIPKLYSALFRFEKIIKEDILEEKRIKFPNELPQINETDFYKWIEDLTQISSETIKEGHRTYKKKYSISNFSKKFLPNK